MTNYQDQHQGWCKHEPWVQDGRVWLANDDDGYYKQDFINREEIEELISKLRAAADEAWPLAKNLSIDLDYCSGVSPSIGLHVRPNSELGGPMTDLTLNDLSHLSDAEFNSLCPQGEHAPGSQLLSPAAQAILDAYQNAPIDDGLTAAAILRAAASQLTSARSSDKLRAIANELEAMS